MASNDVKKRHCQWYLMNTENTSSRGMAPHGDSWHTNATNSIKLWIVRCEEFRDVHSKLALRCSINVMRLRQ